MAPQHTVGAEQDKEAQDEEQQRLAAAAGVAWPLLMQLDSIRTQLPVACKLLCCSKALAAAVAEHSAGQLDMPSTADKAEQAALWLRKHARLLRSLDLQRMDSCVAALVAAGPQTLALQSLTVTASNAALPLLEQLPASRLTHLELWVNDCLVQPHHQPAHVARVSAALGRLTVLRNLNLELSRRGCVGAPPLSGLSALTQLTALSFRGLVSDLQHVPPQLLELQVMGRGKDDGEAPLLDLRHLTAATALDIRRLPVKEDDQLPPNLLRLQIDHCWSVRPLLPLVQLQQLQLGLGGHTDFTTDQLQQLSRLTALRLCCSEDVTEPASAGAWPLLPLQQLELAHVILSAPVCRHLSQLTGLTSLVLQSFELPQAGSAQQLAAALRQLSGLQQLKLLRPLWPDTASNADKAAGMQQLVQAIGSLQPAAAA